MTIRVVALDIGETIASDDRIWASWARWLGVRPHTLSALVGIAVSQGRDNSDAVQMVRPGVDVASERAARDAVGEHDLLTEEDLYDDVRPALTALRATGVRVVIAGNQSAAVGDLLRGLALPADQIATSAEWGVSKPAGAFFQRLVHESAVEPGEVVYVGDHPHNDLWPAAEAGLLTAHLRRGPWGHYWADDPAVIARATWRINTLTELPDLVTG